MMNLTIKNKNTSPSQKPRLGLQTVLKAIALLLTISIFLVGIIDVDPTYDTWGYHLPFAARIWNIVPAEQFINMEPRFAGFPLLGEFFQGFFWSITQRVQGANLVGFFSLVLYAYFLKSYFNIAYYLTAIALLGVPLIQAHAVNSYVDLIANVFLAMMIMMAYVLYQQQDNPRRRDLWVIFLAGVGSSNSKPQLEPLVFIVLAAIAIRILWLRWRSTNRRQLFAWLVKAIPVALLASLVIFATPLKNIAIHGNPFYPVRIEIAGQVLNHTLPMYSDAPGYLADAPNAQRWLYSILEINSAYWNHDQYSQNPDRNRMGGFFRAYVVLQVLLLIYLIAKNRDRQTKLAGILVLVMSLIAANYPQSHELRYFIYWMMVLISLNLYLVTHHKDPLIKPSRFGLLCLIALIIVGIKTNFVYLAPRFNTLAVFKDQYINREIIAKIEPGDNICLPNTYPYAFAYTPWFHPELNYTYRVRSGFRDPCPKSEKVF
ncbi:MAG: hypothetical protein ACFCU7_16690 [Pleurocapsa sp.]